MEGELKIDVTLRQPCRIQGGSSLRDLVPLIADEPEVYLVFDKNVAWVAEKVTCGAVKGSFAIDASEEGKSMETVLSISRWLMEAGASRKALLVAIGGGITTDMAGFAASIYKRGIRYANVPTTLLAQVDAAIGGKNGVNLDGYKNMLGTITQPIFTFLCADVLRTLPLREFRCGVAEMLKTFLLADADAYTAAIRLLSTNNAQNVDGSAKIAVQNRPKTWTNRPRNCRNCCLGPPKSRPALCNGTRLSRGSAPSSTWAIPSAMPLSTRRMNAEKTSSTAKQWPWA